MVTIPNLAPILTIDQGLLVIKDIFSLGYLSTVSKTELAFTSTYTDCVPSDVGKRVRVNGALITDLVLAGYKNEFKLWWLSGSTSIASGSQITIDGGGTGAGTTSSASSTYGGGAIYIGHGLTDPTDIPKIILRDSGQGYDTLYIRKFDGTPAHLDLGNLTVQGNLSTLGRIGVSSQSVFQQTAESNTPTYLIHNAYNDGSWHNIDGSTKATLLKLDGSGATSIWTTGAGNAAFVNTLSLDYAGNLTAAGAFNGLNIATLGGIWTNMYNSLSNGILINYNTGHAWSDVLQVFNGGTSMLAHIDASGNFMTIGSITAYGDVHVGGEITVGAANYIGWYNSGGTALDTYLSRSSANVLSINNGAGGLGVLDAGGLFASWINATNPPLVFLCNVTFGSSSYGGVNLRAAGYSGTFNGNIGDGTYAGSWGAVWSNYLKYHTDHSAFDSIDDLALVKGYTTKIVTKQHPITNQEYTEEVIDPSSLSFLQDENGFYDPARNIGFLLGCSKALAKKEDEQDGTLLQLLEKIEAQQKDIENLRLQIQQLTNNGDVKTQ
jgi:hypothetical protein